MAFLSASLRLPSSSASIRFAPASTGVKEFLAKSFLKGSRQEAVRRLAVMASAQQSEGATAVTSEGAAASVALVDEEDPSFWKRVQAHQGKAARLTPVEEARTVLERCSRGILSTSSQKHRGYPVASSVAYASEPSGSALLAVSSLSAHTTDLLASPQCSLLISQDFGVPAEAVVTLVGDAVAVEGEKEKAEARETYLKKHPSAFWVDFGDFRFIRIQPKSVKIVANVATMAVGATVSEFSGEKFCATAPDPIAPAEKPVAAHMNADHEDALVAIAQGQLGVKVPGAQMLTLDRLGFVLEVPFKEQSSRVRIPFPREASSRKEVKDLLVEMTRAAKKTSQ